VNISSCVVFSFASGACQTSVLACFLLLLVLRLSLMSGNKGVAQCARHDWRPVSSPLRVPTTYWHIRTPLAVCSFKRLLFTGGSPVQVYVLDHETRDVRVADVHKPEEPFDMSNMVLRLRYG
jgi:hypothetical protein